MKNVVKSMMVVVGMVVAMQAGAMEPNPLRLLADGQADGCAWHLYMNAYTGKMEIMVDTRCGNDIRHYVEEGSVVCEESGPVVNRWSYEIACFRAVDCAMIPGAAVPKIHFIKHNQYGFAGLSVTMYKVAPKYSAQKRPYDVISIDFRVTYPMKALFTFNALRMYDPMN